MESNITVAQKPTKAQDICQTCGLDRNMARETLSEPVWYGSEESKHLVLNENRQTVVFAASGCDECKKMLGLD